MPQGHGMKLTKSLSPALPSGSSTSPHGSEGISKQPEEAEMAEKHPLSPQEEKSKQGPTPYLQR